MIEEFVPKLRKELELEGPMSGGEEGFALQLDNTAIQIKDAAPGFQLSSTLGELPSELPELFYVKLLRGNFMRQASYGAVIGLDENASKITLQLHYPLKSTYRDFKERLEDFINLIDFWRAEIESHKSAPNAN